MLSDFKIRGFRCFDELNIPSLRRLNLITGKNSTGKTTLLEALRVYACDGSPDDLAVMLDVRGESSETSAVDALATIFGVSRGPSAPYDWAHKSCELGPAGDPLQLRMRWHRQDRKSKGWTETEERSGSEPFLIASSRDVEDRVSVDWTKFRNSAFEVNLPSCFVPIQGMSAERMDANWQQTVLEGKDAEIIKALNLIEPGIARLAFVRDSRTNKTQARIAFQDGRKPRPLSALGAGVFRLLGLLLACHNAQAGLLLVDEIDTGLHYSVQTRMWELLTVWAVQFDVQIFATTHSLDCVRAFADVARRNGESDKETGEQLAQVIRLGRRGDEHLRAFLFEDPEVFEMVAKDELEVR